MKSENNSDRMVCLNNLLNTVKHEVPFVRDKGLDARLIDTPITSIETLDSEVTALIEKYEKRINSGNVSILMEETGDYKVNINTIEK